MQPLGTNGGWLELAMGDEQALHAQWSPRIAPVVRTIHAHHTSGEAGVFPSVQAEASKSTRCKAGSIGKFFAMRG